MHRTREEFFAELRSRRFAIVSLDEARELTGLEPDQLLGLWGRSA